MSICTLTDTELQSALYTLKAEQLELANQIRPLQARFDELKCTIALVEWQLSGRRTAQQTIERLARQKEDAATFIIVERGAATLKRKMTPAELDKAIEELF